MKLRIHTALVILLACTLASAGEQHVGRIVAQGSQLTDKGWRITGAAITGMPTATIAGTYSSATVEHVIENTQWFLVEADGERWLMVPRGGRKVDAMPDGSEVKFHKQAGAVWFVMQPTAEGSHKAWYKVVAHGRADELVPPPQPKPAANEKAHVTITSVPDAAEIEIDGKFVGQARAELDLPLGDHTVVVRKAGYKAWARTVTLVTGSTSLRAELEKSDLQ